ncbi:MAG TPA: hypothetical protein VH143_31745 [Kofleriaceae bacterium]|jgi:hypothetical protein|nr:hypothetical protein [Kofleriaceae bacterium]
MAESTEPRALTAALAAPAFSTKVGSHVMHVATRHAERWAPESSASNVRTLRNLGFVDRLVAPWIEAAQRSASLRLFSQYRNEGMPERPTTQTSWLFPRPWYQDELDWMAAARQASESTGSSGSSGSSGSNESSESQSRVAPTMLTTRGTYVVPSEARRAMAMPTALYEYVAPSLSVAAPQAQPQGMPIALPRDVYSPLVPAAAVHAAHVIQRAMAPITGGFVAAGDHQAAVARMSPGLRAVLSTMLERTAISAEPTRLASSAPELVTPPAPRADTPVASTSTAIERDLESRPSAPSVATQTVVELQAQRAQLVELQRAARIVAERELVARLGSQDSQRAATTTTTPTTASTSSPAPRSERSEIEARVAQRIAERQHEQVAERQHEQVAERVRIERAAVTQREQRLHEAARESAVRDARAAASADIATQVTHAASAAPTMQTQSSPGRALPPELALAMAALSPALASTVAASLAREPERAVQTIGELNEALRTAELIARTTASGGSFESVRGPRLMMPAGLGGLVATVEQSAPSASRLSRAFGSSPTSLPSLPSLPTGSSRRAASVAPVAMTYMRVPATAWTAPGAPVASFGSTPALAAAEANRPAALQHVAWADRWLARFAGARTESLDVLTASSSASPSPIAGRANAAPEAVFVAPMLPRALAPESIAAPAASSTAPVASADVPVQRFDDNAETPDDVFASIAAAAGSARTRSRVPARTSPGSADVVAIADANVGLERQTFADVLAHAAPAAPNAGLSAQLASSPFAPAFRHVLPLAAAPMFDVRALFGGNLVASYLAGVLASSTDALPTAMREPVWLSSALASTLATVGSSESASSELARGALDWEPSYVAPVPDTVSSSSPSAMAPPSDHATAEAPSAGTGVAIERQLTTVRSALLALEVEFAATGEHKPVSAQPAQITIAAPTSPAHSMAMAMALPMIGELATVGGAVGVAHAGGVAMPGVSYAAPGMIADRAQAWSIAQERSVSDLAFDFVTPELVLAARVYGLGPAEAAQAARLAIAGPGGLATMASTVDRAFVQAFAVEAERRAQAITAYPRTDASARNADVATRSTTSGAATTSGATTTPGAAMTPSATAATPSFAQLPTSSFGVDRRPPRGAFMWPPATVAALGLTAAAPDGEQSMSVAALELLAAQAVAELGTYAAFAPDRPDRADAVATTASAQPLPATPGESATSATTIATSALEAAIRGSAPSDSEVLAAATAMVPTSRHAKLEAMYVALGQSHAARSWSPAARAARALALAGRGDESITAFERASIAWDVLPIVAPSIVGDASPSSSSYDELAPGASRSTGSTGSTFGSTFGSPAARAQAQAAQKRALMLPEYVESRPGLAGLSARAGEALGSYVAPSLGVTSASSSSSSSREPGAMRRVPSAAQEMVRTGRPSGRFGGGEVEIPTWFESAARKMFDEKSSSGPASELSLTELTLISAAPSNQIAASTRSQPSAVPSNPNPSAQGALATKDTPIDIEKVANDVYRQILVMMDAARARNGEPYL